MTLASQDDSAPPPPPSNAEWNSTVREALAQAGGSIKLPGPCTYRLIVQCGSASAADHIRNVFTTAFGYGRWEMHSAGQEGGQYQLHGLRTVKRCTLEELLLHYREVAEVIGREVCGSHRIMLEAAT